MYDVIGFEEREPVLHYLNTSFKGNNMKASQTRGYSRPRIIAKLDKHILGLNTKMNSMSSSFYS